MAKAELGGYNIWYGCQQQIPIRLGRGGCCLRESVQTAGRAGLKLLQDIADRTDLTARKNDYGGSKYLTDPKYMGDMDAERTRVIEAILAITKATK